jgi:hypothetical protein
MDESQFQHLKTSDAIRTGLPRFEGFKAVGLWRCLGMPFDRAA